MADSVAAEEKKKGNLAFNEQNYPKAVEHYTAAITHDPHNAVLFSNRAAAHLELRNFPDALRDAEHSAALLPTAKAYARQGRAHRALGNDVEALKAYKEAKRLDPRCEDYRVAVDEIEGKKYQQHQHSPPNSPTSSGSGGHAAGVDPTKAFWLDAAVIVAAVIHLPCIFLAPGIAMACWKASLMAFLVRQVMNRGVGGSSSSSAPPPPGFNLEYAKYFATSFVNTATFTGQFIIITLVLLIMGVQPMHLFYISLCIYCALDAMIVHAHTFNATLPRLGPLGNFLLTQQTKVQSNRDYLLANAAMLEVVNGCLVFFIGGSSIMVTIVYWQFLKWRYRSDAWARLAFQAMSQQMGKLFYHPRCPGILGTGFTKLKEGMHKMATS